MFFSEKNYALGSGFDEISSGDFPDDEDFGSGDFVDDEDFDPQDWKEYTLENLKKCTTYTFNLNRVGDNKMVHTSAKTECDEEEITTTIAPPTTTEKPIEMDPLQNITLETDPATGQDGGLLKVNWIAAPNVHVTWIIESEPIKFKIEKSFKAEEKPDLERVRF